MAKSLLTLIDQVDARWPNRKKGSDGTIASAEHSARNPSSDHEVRDGVVRALDITNDPAHGVVSREIGNALIASRDPRIKYVIRDNQIASSKVSPWKWRDGSYGHFEHVHISVVDDPKLQDDTRPWALPGVVPPVSARRELEKGMSGDDVAVLQAVLGIEADGDFGPITEAQVRAFQSACNIDSDGIVGPITWAQVDALVLRVKAGSTGLSDDLVRQIVAVARASPLMSYRWPGRGVAPAGYIPGMCLTFAVALQRLEAKAGDALVMAQAKGDPDVDALAWLEVGFRSIGIAVSGAGVDTLRALFVLMIGLGMRESSGRYCEGGDMSAANTSSETAEAALFQTSWNIWTADPSLPKMLDEFWKDPVGFLGEFKSGVIADASDLDCYGSGNGVRYQWLAKYCPLFAVLTTGVGLRKRRKHWGPVNRREVTLLRDADTLLRKVQHLAERAPMSTEPPTAPLPSPAPPSPPAPAPMPVPPTEPPPAPQPIPHPTPTPIPLNWAQQWAAARHVISALAGVAIAVGVISQGDVTAWLARIDQIAGAVGILVTAIGVLLPIVMAGYASMRASLGTAVERVQSLPVSVQAQALAERPEVEKIVVDSKAIADAAPSKKVVSN